MKRPALQDLLLLGAVVACAIGQGALYWWYVEDAAISMAYARNFAEGWGMVRYPGGARVEGYSNPLWVLYMAAGYLVGIDGFTSVKIAAGALGCFVSVPLVYLLAKRAEVEIGWAYLAGWVLALDAQFIIWSACGLENSLFCALLALGCWATLREADKGGFPWAAVWFLGLSLTRPEGIVYAAFGGFMALVLEAAGSRRWLRILGWLALFWIPFLAYHAVRFDYFAYEFPATYYSKLEDAKWAVFRWDGRAWMYFRNFCFETGRGFFLPVFIFGALGLRGWRGVVAVGLSVWLSVLLLWPGVEPLHMMGLPKALWTPPMWVEMRIVSLGMVAFCVPFLAAGGKGWRVRVLMWGMALLALLFCLRSTGDWMRGFRWLSLVSIPASVLLALGCAEIAGAIERFREGVNWRRAGIAVGIGVFVASAIPEVVYQVRYKPEVGPFAMKRRVDHYRWAMNKLFMERAHIIDHDMGAALYWGVELGLIRDAKGLIDYPFALHHHQSKFVEEYIFDEHKFDLAHAHASTGRALRRVNRRFQREYLEFPGYGGGQTLHVGNFVRKSLLVTDDWKGPTARSAVFEDEIVLHGLNIRAPEVQTGSFVFVEFGLSTRPRPAAPFRMLMTFVREDGEGQFTADVPLGLEDWYPVEEWKAGEIFKGRVALKIPPRVAEGRYGAAVSIVGVNGAVSAIEAGEKGTLDHEPHYATGEVYFADVMRVMDQKGVKNHAAKDIGAVTRHANRLECEDAERAWMNARAHFIQSHDWQASVRPPVANAITNCWAVRAERAPKGKAVGFIRRAREWDPTHPAVFRVGTALGEAWFQEAEQLRAEGRTELAFRAYVDTLHADPSRAWARRYAEELRAQRLKLR